MANNLVVQLLLKTGTFSTDLKTARGQIQNFQKGCQTAGKSFSAFGQAIGVNVGQLTKFGSVIGIAAVAGKEFKAIIDSNQTSADAFEGAIAGCKGVLDSFNTAIATADFTAFSDGLWGVYDAAKAVQDAIDQLQNTQLAYDYKSKQNMTAFQEAYNVFKDPASTDKMKEDAKAQMKAAVDAQFEYARNYSSALYKTYVAQVVKKAGGSNLRPNNVTIAQFEKAMNIDLSENPAAGRAEIESQYREYLSKLKEYKGNNLTAQEDLKKRYRDVIAIHAMLELMKDDELKGVAQLLMGMEDAKQQALSMQKTYNRVTGTKETGQKQTKTTTTKKEELDIQEESLTYWKNVLSEETKYRDALVKGTDEWNLHNQKVDEANKKIKEIEGNVENVSKAEEGSLKHLQNMLSEFTQLRDQTNYESEEWDRLNAKVLELQKQISQYDTSSKLNDALAIQPPTIDSLQTVISLLQVLRNQTEIGSQDFIFYTEALERYQKKLATLTGTTVTAPPTDKWNQFNQAMSQTSTIVSSLTSAFQEGSEVTAASILKMVATSLPAIGSLIGSIQALTAAEAVEAGVAATGKAVSSSKHWIEAIAAVAALGAVVAAAISSAKSQKFANGGIVGGNSYTGDRVTANVNSGEMILNKTQQANLFRMANGGVTGGNQVEFHISGTDLVGVLNNNNRKNRLIR